MTMKQQGKSPKKNKAQKQSDEILKSGQPSDALKAKLSRRKAENEKKLDMEKLYPIHIDDLTDEGEGVGRIEGMTVFVHNALPGDFVLTKLIKRKKNYAIGIIHHMMEPSPSRITAPCPHARQCGGCQLQEYDYAAQTAYKARALKEALARIGGLEAGSYIDDGFIQMDSPSAYRNKGIYQMAPEQKQCAIGFYRKRSHDIINIQSCMLQTPNTNTLIHHLRAWIVESGISIYSEITREGTLRRVMIRDTQDGEHMMLVLVVTQKDDGLKRLVKCIEREMPQTLKSVYLNLNADPGNTALSYTYEHLLGEETIVDAIGEAKFIISPESFFQINRVQTERLYQVVAQYAETIIENQPHLGTKTGTTSERSIAEHGFTVLDLYCGIGSIGIYLSKQLKGLARVVGIEVIEGAILDARLNAEFNGLTNTSYHVGKAEDIMPQLKGEGVTADIVILDPPRKGCEESLLETLVEMDVQHIIYVSCKPATLARDLKFLTANGYTLERVTGVDMFPWTGHCEAVSLLVKR